MEMLQRLEEKIASLLVLLKTLKTDNEDIKFENQELKTENAKLAEENGQLTSKVGVAENQRTNQLEETRLMVDDLIKNIDTLVKNEQP